MTIEQAIEKLRTLEWTEEVRASHPWRGCLLVRRSEVEQIIRDIPVKKARF